MFSSKQINENIFLLNITTNFALLRFLRNATKAEESHLSKELERANLPSFLQRETAKILFNEKVTTLAGSSRNSIYPIRLDEDGKSEASIHIKDDGIFLKFCNEESEKYANCDFNDSLKAIEMPEGLLIKGVDNHSNILALDSFSFLFEKLILSNLIYADQELIERGIVDFIVPDSLLRFLNITKSKFFDKSSSQFDVIDKVKNEINFFNSMKLRLEDRSALVAIDYTINFPQPVLGKYVFKKNNTLAKALNSTFDHDLESILKGLK